MDKCRVSCGQMNQKNETKRLKILVFELLKVSDFNRTISKIARLPQKKVVNYLISALCNSDPLVKWRAVSVLGQVVAYLANRDMEDARVIMRRFMWMLNDESGGIGWGVPESMAEIMACHVGLAREYAGILVSYLREDANFLEYEPLQRGLLWGISRLGSVRAEFLLSYGVEKHLPSFLKSDDLEVRTLAAWACGVLGLKSVREILEKMKRVDETILFYWDYKLGEIVAGNLVNEALNRLG